MRWEVWLMTLKSLVNKSIIKSDLRRYWYLGAIFAIMLLLMAVMPAYLIVESYTKTQATSSPPAVLLMTR